MPAKMNRIMSATTGRAKPGSRGGGQFFHVELRPSRDFIGFRVQDVGKPGGVERVAGLRKSGRWQTAKWLIAKTDAHVESGILVGDTAGTRKLLSGLGSPAKLVRGDRFRATPHRNIPDGKKPTPAIRHAQQANIKKVLAAVRRKRGTKHLRSA
ncbi:MAG: hypothetical protein OJF62_000587 [Pseudolabrys sp.]|jgi:hypothetical protein|nr:hypothetical protein [Pseudolabrys sp.]